MPMKKPYSLRDISNRLKNDPDEIILRSIKHGSPSISYKRYKRLYDSLNETIRELAYAGNILVIDLAQEIPQEKVYV